MTAVPLTRIDSLRPLLNGRPLGLFSDIDGTLSPIVERPEDATVTPRCRSLLQSLIREDVRVALITGRPLTSARAMVGIDEVAYAANHGLEYWLDGRVELAEGVEGYPALVEQIVTQSAYLPELGVQPERKGPGVAFHFRRAPDTEAAQHFAIREGRKVIELRPDVNASKGSATKLLAKRLGVKAILCMGDDRTDIDMFEAVKHLCNRGVDGAAVAVLSAESPPELLAASDYTVEGVEGVEWLLGEVLRAVGGTSP